MAEAAPSLREQRQRGRQAIDPKDADEDRPKQDRGQMMLIITQKVSCFRSEFLEDYLLVVADDRHKGREFVEQRVYAY